MAKRIRTPWQRTPKIIRECVDEGNRLQHDMQTIIDRLNAEIVGLKSQRDMVQAGYNNMLVQRDEAQHTLKILANVEKIDVVIPAIQNGHATYYVVRQHKIEPVFGTNPGDKILLARKKIL